MSKKVSICLCDVQKHYGDKHAIEIAKKIGADGIDFSLYFHNAQNEGDLYTKDYDEVREYYRDIRAYADSLGVKIHQTHGRFLGYGVSPEVDAALVRNLELDAIASGILGAEYCVVHTPAYNHVGGDRTDEEMFDIFYRTFGAMLPFAKREGVKIAAETHGDASKYKKMEFFGYIDNLIKGCDGLREKYDAGEYIAVCVDTGHTNLAVKYEGNPSVGDAIRQLGSRVQALHLHDNNGMRDQHKIPMTGDLNWEDIMNALDEVGFDGWYNLENNITNFGKGFWLEEAEFAVKVMRNIIKNYTK